MCTNFVSDSARDDRVSLTLTISGNMIGCMEFPAGTNSATDGLLHQHTFDVVDLFKSGP